MKFITGLILLVPLLVKGQGEVPANYEFQIQFDSVYEIKQYTFDDIYQVDDRGLWLKHHDMEALGSMDTPYFFAVKNGVIDTFPVYDEIVVITKGPGLMFKAIPVEINGISKIISHEMIEFGGRKILKIISSYLFKHSTFDPLEEGKHITLIDLENNIRLCSIEIYQGKTYNFGQADEFTEAENYLFEISKNSIRFYLANDASGANEITPSNRDILLQKGAKPTFYMEYDPGEKKFMKRG